MYFSIQTTYFVSKVKKDMPKDNEQAHFFLAQLDNVKKISRHDVHGEMPTEI